MELEFLLGFLMKKKPKTINLKFHPMKSKRLSKTPSDSSLSMPVKARCTDEKIMLLDVCSVRAFYDFC